MWKELGIAIFYLKIKACVLFSKFYTMTPMPIGFADRPIGSLHPTSPPPRTPRMPIDPISLLVCRFIASGLGIRQCRFYKILARVQKIIKLFEKIIVVIKNFQLTKVISFKPVNNCSLRITAKVLIPNNRIECLKCIYSWKTNNDHKNNTSHC